jgi:hypothetical protein
VPDFLQLPNARRLHQSNQFRHSLVNGKYLSSHRRAGYRIAGLPEQEVRRSLSEMILKPSVEEVVRDVKTFTNYLTQK